MATRQETKKALYHKYNPIMIISAYGFSIAIGSFLFMKIGRKFLRFLLGFLVCIKI